jgi:hypothetical protein
MSLHNFSDKRSRADMSATFQGDFVPGVGHLRGWGTTVGNGLQNWAPGAIFTDTNAAQGSQVYVNAGTSTTASWVEIADAGVVGGFTLEATASIAGQGSTIVGLMPAAAQQALSGAGAVNITTYYTAVTNTGSDALTLADGAQIGQLKKIKMIVDPGTDSILTPSNFAGGSTITFADVGDYVVLMWNGTNWVAIELGNDADGATAPAVA